MTHAYLGQQSDARNTTDSSVPRLDTRDIHDAVSIDSIIWQAISTNSVNWSVTLRSTKYHQDLTSDSCKVAVKLRNVRLDQSFKILHTSRLPVFDLNTIYRPTCCVSIHQSAVSIGRNRLIESAVHCLEWQRGIQTLRYTGK